jgi:peptidase M23-like protein
MLRTSRFHSRSKKLCLPPFLAVLALLIPSLAFGQVRKSCPDGVTLRASTGVSVQGSVVLTEVLGAKSPGSISSEWDGAAMPLWKESEKSAKSTMLHGLIGVDLEKHPGKHAWKVSWTGADGNEEACSIWITVRAGKFATERLTVEKQFVQPDPEQEKRAVEEQKKMRAIYDTVTPERLWDGKFRLPLKDVNRGGNFGRRRVLNGEARSPHAGVDFPTAAGTAVFASQSGRVALAEELFYAGNTVVIDHGYGIYSLYAHLSQIEAHAGDTVKAGEEIGKVGATGRVTGPHLHWGLTIEHARVNGLNLVQRQP